MTLDLADVLDDATFGTLPANTSLVGTTLTWNVPATAVAATSTAVLPLTVKADADRRHAQPDRLRPVDHPRWLLHDVHVVTHCRGPRRSRRRPTRTITGTPKVGATLTADTAGWAVDATFGYVWKRNGTAIAGATSRTYPLVGADLGQRPSPCR